MILGSISNSSDLLDAYFFLQNLHVRPLNNTFNL
jgi:hypothetical protein